jgi:hypothetical protein
MLRKSVFLVVFELYERLEIFIKTQDKLNWCVDENMKKKQDTRFRRNKENLEFGTVIDDVLIYDASLRKRPI